MAKHIKILAKLTNSGDAASKVEVLILHQSHAEQGFGILQNNIKHGSRMFKSGSFALYGPSGHSPKVYKDPNFFNGTLFLMHQEPILSTDRAKSFYCSLEEFKHFKKLVKAYNIWGAKQDA